MQDISATYSPEDNKIRLYPDGRFDAETLERVKKAGFRWAPKQKLFVAPKWTTAREDIALELAGEIEPEEMTLAERAQIKAERLDGYAEKRAAESNAFAKTAQDLSQAFEFGQPILVGHHSERKARKTQDRMNSAMEKSVKANATANYWLYRAEGVEHHANRKNDPRVRARRIKTLLAELRDLQRGINHGHNLLEMWERWTTDAQILKALSIGQIKSGPVCGYDYYRKVEAGEIEPQDARNGCIESAKTLVNGPRRQRWITHTLNRLSYERDLLGDVPRYNGEITPGLLQIFVREHGAQSPKATKSDIGFVMECSAPLPLHIGQGKTLELSTDEWRDLMQSVGYNVPAKKPAKPPILNFKANTLCSRSPYRRGEINELEQVAMTKAEYGKIHSEQRGTRLSVCGRFRFKVCPHPFFDGPRYQAPWVAIFLTDSKVHPTPEPVEDCEAAA